MAVDPKPESLETKLAAARTRLILDKPFLGALVLRLPLTPARGDWCPTTATDARSFYYNREYVEGLSLDETQFVLAHEALHCALSHFARRQHRLKGRWDRACDLAINPILIEEGLQPPPGSLFEERFRDMTAEEIYPCLDEEEQEPLDRHLYDPDDSDGGNSGDGDGDGDGDIGQADRPDREPEQGARDHERPGDQGTIQSEAPPPPLTPEERDNLKVQWQQRLAGAAQQAQQAGKLSAQLARLIDHLLQPQLPWRVLLAQHLSSAARDDYSYTRPSRRTGEFIFPALRSSQIDVVVALDTSGSIHDDEIAAFVAEVDALKSQVRARITLLACDAALAAGAPWIFEPWEAFQIPESIDGGGGTDFRPVFNWIEEQGIRPELLLYFTDADGTFPQVSPSYPVAWLVKGRHPVPWGRRIQLN